MPITLPVARALVSRRRHCCRGPADPPERLRAGAEVGSATVVLEAGQHATPGAGQFDLDRHVADQARSVGADRADVEQPDPRQLLVAELVGVTEQLVAAADPEHDRAALGGGVQRRRACARRGQRRTAPGRDPGRRPCSRGRRRRGSSSSPIPHAGQLEADAAPLAAALAASAGCRGRRRCSSGRGTARRRAASAGSDTEDHHLAADVLVGGGDLRARRAVRGRPRCRPRSDASTRDDVKRDAVLARRVRAPSASTISRRRSSTKPSPRAPHRCRLAEVDDAVDLGDVGQRARVAVVPLELLEVLGGGDRDGHDPAGSRCAARGAKKARCASARRRAAGSSASARRSAGSGGRAARTSRASARDRLQPAGRRRGARARRSSSGRSRARRRGARRAPAPA